jgi:hypothetical protein
MKISIVSSLKVLAEMIFAEAFTLKIFEDIIKKLIQIIGDDNNFEPNSLQFSEKGLEEIRPLSYDLKSQKTFPDILRRLFFILDKAMVNNDPDTDIGKEMSLLNTRLNLPSLGNEIKDLLKGEDATKVRSAIKIKVLDFAREIAEKIVIKKPGTGRLSPEDLEYMKTHPEN